LRRTEAEGGGRCGDQGPVIDEDNRDDCSTYGDEQNGRFPATALSGPLVLADRHHKSTRADRKETNDFPVQLQFVVLEREQATEERQEIDFADRVSRLR
jgi:hypothetical protein